MLSGFISRSGKIISSCGCFTKLESIIIDVLLSRSYWLTCLIFIKICILSTSSIYLFILSKSICIKLFILSKSICTKLFILSKSICIKLFILSKSIYIKLFILSKSICIKLFILSISICIECRSCIKYRRSTFFILNIGINFWFNWLM